MHQYQWIEAVERAAHELPEDEPQGLVFVETREDLRVVVDRAGTPRTTWTGHRGAAVRRGKDAIRAWHLSDPCPSDLSDLVRGRVRASSNPVDSPNRRLEPARELEGLQQWVDSLAAAPHGDTHIGLEALFVSFDQTVWVGRAGRGAVSDRRRGRRIRISAAVESRGRVAVAVGERVLKGDADPLEMIERIAQRAEERLASRPVPPGLQPVVFSAGVGGVLIHEIVGHALEADAAARGGPLTSGADLKLSPSIHVVDDPRRGRASWRTDDEGESARPVRLLAEGRVTGLLHDLRSASLHGCSPTGHGRRGSFREPVRPRMGCTFLVAGDADPSEVIADTPRGIHVRRMESASFDPCSGTAWFRVTDADRIDRGRTKEPLHPFLLRIEAFEVLNSLDLIASDLAFDTCIGTCLRDGQPVAVSVGAPTFRTGVATAVS